MMRWPCSALLLLSFLLLPMPLPAEKAANAGIPFLPPDWKDPPAPEPGHEGHGHAPGAHDEHGTDPMDLSEAVALTRPCEHGMAAAACSHCQSSVGVVTIREDLIHEPAQVGGGLIHLGQVRLRSMGNRLRVPGRVGLAEDRSAHLTSRVAGVIRKVRVDLGQRVQKGETLLHLESMEAGEAAGAWEKARALLRLARKNHDRERDLFEKKISAQKDYIAAETALEEARIEYEASSRKLRMLGIETEKLDADPELRRELGLGLIPLRAPIAGEIVYRHAVEGEYAEPGEAILQVTDLDRVWVWAELYARDIPRILTKGGQTRPEAELRVKAYLHEIFRGRVDYVGAMVDEKTRTLKARILVDNPAHLLRPGMYCDVELLLGEERKVTLPKDAVLFDEGRRFVFKRIDKTRFLQRPVEIGAVHDDMAILLTGLEAGDWVATDGAFLLKSEALRAKMGAG